MVGCGEFRRVVCTELRIAGRTTLARFWRGLDHFSTVFGAPGVFRARLTQNPHCFGCLQSSRSGALLKNVLHETKCGGFDRSVRGGECVSLSVALARHAVRITAPSHPTSFGHYRCGTSPQLWHEVRPLASRILRAPSPSHVVPPPAASASRRERGVGVPETAATGTPALR